MVGLKFDQEKLSEVCRKYGVTAVYVHGSRVKGYAAPDSDTDIAVVVENREKQKRGGFLSYKVANEIEDVLRVKNPDVRVVDLNSSPLFLFEIISSGEVIYQKDDQVKLGFEEGALRAYYDTEYLREVYANYLFQDIKSAAYAN
ncbi:MAG: hypothetical protein UX80_C0006G0065 [Candidatus Amesbacteria bacterium GW2011_GWA2_47_11b]|uniref:Polymerase beta nucleotidyltransferase domain-containing protein n=2 Tax=Candidatus Amesiibacteriota TaxID=1752730 RepID=A0A0G1SI82_9BACT|nr:MAG: hypothetical protein UX42_C0003G0059 [Microgenomates group bacterium GW2011_GWC1_46_20]KKU58095.1 MAG: hypothetical protein UX80_C0006G0065 [Candidatus Amesbacteria bacterium GW2011_GWA2_47_11b]KKU69142.1 MAG: hypothetical protein UX92_C0014G0033 [Candidatus Amesbacteria bacterium GW2011_GWA1_47_20]